MILRSSLSIRGLYHADNTIFNGFHIPESLSLDTLRTLILAECGELEILYPDSDYFKVILDAWSSTKLSEWNRVEELLLEEYDPLLNYSKDTQHTGSESKTKGHQGTDSKNRTFSETDGGTSTSTDSVKGYNETAFVEANKNVTTTSDTKSYTDNSTGTDAYTDSTSGSDTYRRTVTGNIGIQSYSKLIQEEIDLRIQNNLAQLIIDEFKQRFCILVY